MKATTITQKFVKGELLVLNERLDNPARLADAPISKLVKIGDICVVIDESNVHRGIWRVMFSDGVMGNVWEGYLDKVT